MPDLEQRLRDDAAAADAFSPPSLEVALDAALGRRSPVVGWLAAAAVLIVLAGVTVVVASHPGGPRRPAPASVPSISGVPLHRGDESLRPIEDAGIDTAFRVPSDARALDVLVPYSKLRGGCSLFRPRVTVVKQNRSQVWLRASGYSYVRNTPGSELAAPSCNVDETRAVRVQLSAPVGTRTVRGDAAGKSQVRLVTPPAAARPSYVPTGFHLTQVVRSSITHGIATSTLIYQRGDAMLSVDAGDPDAVARLDGPVQMLVTIDGSQAKVYERSGENCVDWVPRGDLVRQVCASGSPLLTVSEVLKVARSLN